MDLELMTVLEAGKHPGVMVQVISRRGDFTRVRDKDGVEWYEREADLRSQFDDPDFHT